nr:wiskott-Aldrich syndrome protein homolog 1-like [Aegilops tauschii subsp. strangulata]
MAARGSSVIAGIKFLQPRPRIRRLQPPCCLARPRQDLASAPPQGLAVAAGLRRSQAAVQARSRPDPPPFTRVPSPDLLPPPRPKPRHGRRPPCLASDLSWDAIQCPDPHLLCALHRLKLTRPASPVLSASPASSSSSGTSTPPRVDQSSASLDERHSPREASSASLAAQRPKRLASASPPIGAWPMVSSPPSALLFSFFFPAVGPAVSAHVCFFSVQRFYLLSRSLQNYRKVPLVHASNN